MIKKPLLVFMLVMCSTLLVTGQNDRYSLYFFSNSAINPAKINQNNKMEVSGVFRSQQASAGTDLTTTFLDLSYPLFIGKKRWSSIGFSFASDRSGTAGIFQTNEGYLNYALTLVLSRPNIISLGTSIRYIHSQVNIGELSTGSQFVDGTFNPQLSSGEPFDFYQNSYASGSFGAHWKVIDKTGLEKSMLGLSVSNINRPNASLMHQARLPLITIAEVAYRLSYSKKASYYAEVLHSHSTAIESTIVGVRAELNLYRFNPQLKGQELQLLAKYRMQEGLVFGTIWQVNHLSFGATYDIPIGNRVSHLGAFEIAVKYSKLRRPKNKRRRRNSSQMIRRPRATDTEVTESLVERPDKPTDKGEDIDKLQVPEEDPATLDIEKPILLHFSFEFGSTEPTIEEYEVIEEIAQILNENPGKKILIIGHTDNVGSKTTNNKLSFDRAQSIYDILISLGVDPFLMSVVGMGEDEPLSSNKTAEGRAMNRRVEIKFSNE